MSLDTVRVFQIYRWQRETLDSVFQPIRTKKDCIKLLMQTLKMMLITNANIHKDSVVAEVHLISSKNMNRLFYFINNQDGNSKYYSIYFPFSATLKDNEILFSSKNIAKIDNKTIASIMSFLNNWDDLSANNPDYFIDTIFDTIDDIDENIFNFLIEVLLFESGYIRYDYDPKHENGKIHPLHHYDIFYSSRASIKIGLNVKGQFTRKMFIDFLNSTTDCWFIRP